MDLAVVTGAAGDIGVAIAEALAGAGMRLALLDKDGEALAKAADRLRGASALVSHHRCDVTDRADIATAAEHISKDGKVSVLVNNAGGITSASLQSTSAEDWRRDIALNLDAAFMVFKAFEASLIEAAGSVVNIASVNASGVYGHPGYSSAKAGLVHLTEFMAVEYGRHGVRANAVAPGTVATQAWQERAARNPDVLEAARRWYPLKRIATPQDVANAVAFLASPAAGAITGTCLPVDCGLSAGTAALAATFSQSPDFDG
ncbi:MAG: SDR family oxidoreductase [Pseudomonadota bacterium]